MNSLASFRVLASLCLAALSCWAGPAEEAAAHFKAGRADEAETAYSQALAEKGDNAVALIGRARARAKLGNNKGAKEDFSQAVKVAPDNYEAWMYRGIFFEITEENKALALNDYSKVIRLKPKFSTGYYLRGKLLLALEKAKEALTDLETLVRLKPDYAKGYALKGRALELLAYEPSAMEAYEKALQLDPKEPIALEGRQVLAAKQKAQDEKYAITDLSKGVEEAKKKYEAAKEKKEDDWETGSMITPESQSASSSGKTAAKGSAGKAEAPKAAAIQPKKTAATEKAPVAQKSSAPEPRQAAKAPAVPVDLSYIHNSNFLLVTNQGSFACTTNAGDRSGDRKPGGFGPWGIPILWSGDEFYYSGQRPEMKRSGMGMFWKRQDLVFSVWGKLSPDGSMIQTLRLLCQRGENSEFALEFRDLALNKQPESAGTPTEKTPSYARQGANNADSDEMVRALVKIRDVNSPYQGRIMVDGEQRPDPATIATLTEFRPAGCTIGIYRDVDLPECKSSASLEDLRSGLEGYFSRQGIWAAIKPITDAKLAELDPQMFAKRVAGNLLEVKIDPAGKRELLADGSDTITLRARVNAKGGGTTAAQAAATKSIRFSGVGEGADWLDFSRDNSELEDGWKVAQVQASLPDSVRKGAQKPPSEFTIRITAQDNGRQILETRKIAVGLNPEIDAKPDLVEFSAQSGQTASVRVAIENPGQEAWQFRAEYETKSRPLATVAVRTLDKKSAELTLKEAGLDPLSDGSNDERSVLRIFAEQENRPTLERDIKVCVAQEGLFVATTGLDPHEQLFRLYGDGSGKATEIDFRVFVQNSETNKIENLARKRGALKDVSIECLELRGMPAANALEACGFKAEVLSAPRPLNEPAGIIRMSLAKEVPGDGRIIPCDFRISYPGRDEGAFSAIITIGIVPTSNGPGSMDWHIELDRCQEVVNKFVPAAYYPKMQALLDKRKVTLGAEGLRTLRSKLWMTAAELTLGEGGRGYADETKWANRIAETLDWAQWAGEMAFGAALGTWAGPYVSMGAGVAKTALISAINAYQEGLSPEQWLWDNLSTIPGMIEGKIIDVDTFEQLGMQSKVKIWALYISYNFLKNLYQEQSIIEAIKKTGGDVSNTVLSNWVSSEVMKHGNRNVSGWLKDKGKQAAQAASSAVSRQPSAAKSIPVSVAKTDPASPSKPAPDEQGAPAKKAKADDDTQRKTAADDDDNAAAGKAAAQKPTPAQEAEAVSLVRSRMSVGPDGVPCAHPEDVLLIMRDPSMVRALKNAPPEVQEAFSRTRNAIYRQHDAAVVQHVKDSVPGMKNRLVKVMEFRTPGETGPSLNTDRDYRVCYYAGRNAKGQEVWIEVPRTKWEDKSYQEFARATGGPSDTPEAAKEWAAKHQQLATDKFHAEASRDFSDQKKVWNPQTRRYESVQVDSNFKKVTEYQKGENDLKGKVSLEDPQSLGHMYQMKVGDAHHQHEAFVQANKAVGALIAVRKSYNVQGRNIGKVPDKMLAGMDAIIKVNEKLKADPNRRDPVAIAEAQRTLRELGFHDLGDFMNKVSSQFESLKLVEE